MFGIVGGGMEHCPGLHPGIAEIEITMIVELASNMQTCVTNRRISVF